MGRRCSSGRASGRRAGLLARPRRRAPRERQRRRSARARGDAARDDAVVNVRRNSVLDSRWKSGGRKGVTNRLRRIGRLISLISCIWDAHRPVPGVSTEPHPRRIRCGIKRARGPLTAICIFQWRRSAMLIGERRREGAGRRVLPSPPVLISESEAAWIMPIAGTFMRGRHAVKQTRGRQLRHAEALSLIGIRNPATCSAETFPHGHATSRISARPIPGSSPQYRREIGP